VADIRRRAQQLSIIAVVVALHIAAYWGFLTATHPFTIRAISQNLELVFIPAPVIPSESSARKPAPTRRSQRASQQGAAIPPDAQPNTAPSSDEGNAIHPPIDWAAELDRAARDAVPAEPAAELRNFGFPHASAAPPKPPEFGWSHTRIHRVESIPGGGMLVHVNDNCVLVFIPLPFFACAPGQKPANGDLFEHMHDPPHAGDWNDGK
jgi:hypothetical protein